MVPGKKVTHLSPPELRSLDLRRAAEPWLRRNAEGKRRRALLPRERHGEWAPAPGRPDPVEQVLAGNAGRVPALVPIRMGRMAESPFTFLRGAAGVMAWDLAHTPSCGQYVAMDGDAHVNNFGLYGTALGEVVLDLNDFDEVCIGPWEWDIKRLSASVNVLGRQNGLNARERRIAVMKSAEAYRHNMARLQSMPVMDLWHLHTMPRRLLDPDIAQRLGVARFRVDAKSRAIIEKAVSKAERQNNAALLTKVAERDAKGGWRFKEEPPILVRVDAATREAVTDALQSYMLTVSPDRRYMLRHYHVVDVAHRVVGVGSVGLRAYLVMLLGNSDGDPLFLQVKEAIEPVHAPYTVALPPELGHNGQRVVFGQNTLQAASDPLLGWTRVAGRDYYVRQMRNLKGSIPLEWLSGTPFNFFVWGFGALLARAHARSGDAAAIAGYCGRSSSALDAALADWAEAYGDQTERDHAALVRAIESGRVKATKGV